MSHKKDQERAEKGEVYRNATGFRGKIAQKAQQMVTAAQEKLLSKEKSYDELAKIAYEGLRRTPAPMSWKRNQVIKGAEQDIREGYAKGLTAEAMLNEMKSSPNYCKLLKLVGVEFEHIEVLLRDLKPNS